LATLFFLVEKLVEKHGGGAKGKVAHRSNATPENVYQGIDKNSPLMQRLQRKQEIVEKRKQRMLPEK
jgi:hypothetical protein